MRFLCIGFMILGTLYSTDIFAQQRRRTPQRRRPRVVTNYITNTIEVEKTAIPTHLVGFSVGMLVQNGQGFNYLSADFEVSSSIFRYEALLPIWVPIGNSALGVSAGFNYTHMFSNFLTVLFQLNFGSTGWIYGAMDLGIGGRFPISEKMFFSVDAHLSIAATGAELKPHPDAGVPATAKQFIPNILMLFGFKTRVAFEFTMTKKSYASLFFAYSFYPWAINSISSDTAFITLNNIPLGSALIGDALTIGVEFGIRISKDDETQGSEYYYYEDAQEGYYAQ